MSAVGGQGHSVQCDCRGSVAVKDANVSRREYIAVQSTTVGMLVVKITKNCLL